MANNNLLLCPIGIRPPPQRWSGSLSSSDSFMTGYTYIAGFFKGGGEQQAVAREEKQSRVWAEGERWGKGGPKSRRKMRSLAPARRSLQPARKEGECIINGFALSRSTDGGRTDLRADMNHLDVRQQLRPTDRPERVFLSANSEQQRMGIQRIRGGCCSLSYCCRSARC